MRILSYLAISLLLINIVIAQDLDSEEEQLMDKIIAWRKTKNLNLGTNNQMQRTLDSISETECENLLHDIDRLGKFDNFPTTVTSQQLGDGEYIAEFIVKAAKSTDYPSSIFNLWTQDTNIAKNLSYEFNEIYGVARVCVMHLKKVNKTKSK